MFIYCLDLLFGLFQLHMTDWLTAAKEPQTGLPLTIPLVEYVSSFVMFVQISNVLQQLKKKKIYFDNLTEALFCGFAHWVKNIIDLKWLPSILTAEQCPNIK